LIIIEYCSLLIIFAGLLLIELMFVTIICSKFSVILIALDDYFWIYVANYWDRIILIIFWISFQLLR